MKAQVIRHMKADRVAGQGTYCPGVRSASVRAVQLALMVMACMGSMPAQAKLAQGSLVVAEPPIIEPNLMFTLDDSGSMLFNFLPDNDGPYQLYTFHPNEPETIEGGYPTRGILNTELDSTLGARRRSPDINTLYYNPEILYEPWMKEDGTRYDPANPKATYYYFNHSTIKLDLTGAVSTRQGPNRGYVCKEMYGPRNGCVFYGWDTRIPNEVYPATYYRLKDDPTNPGKKMKGDQPGHFVRHIIDKEATSEVKSELRLDCQPIGNGIRRCSKEAEYQNFANWYQYHRTRYLLAAAAVSEAFQRQLGKDIRVGYGRINKGYTQVDGVSTKVVERGMRNFEGADKSSFFQWIQKDVAPAGGTPLLGASLAVGKYFERSDAKGPWADIAKKGGQTRYLSCRRSYHILMTDGIYNDNDTKDFDGVTGAINADNTRGPIIPASGKNPSYRYDHTAPENALYRSATERTLGDIATYFWSRDLQPNIPNNVPTDPTNPSFWQNVTMYTLSFGVDGTLPYGSSGRQRQTLEDIRTGKRQWPAKIEQEKPEAIDDLWHAAVNGHGRYLNVKNSTEFVESMRQILAEIAERVGSTAGAAVSSRALQTNNQKFVPLFRSRTRTGNLEAYALNERGDAAERQWSANEQMPHWSLRRAFAGNGTNAGKTAERLSWTQAVANMPSQGLKDTLLKQAGVTATTRNEKEAEGWKVVAYLLGDDNYQKGKFRGRERGMGQIINSNPVYIGAATNHGYTMLPTHMTCASCGEGKTLATMYRDYLKNTGTATSKVHRNRKPVVMVGSNDGFLHAFDAKSGNEVFAYTPYAVLKEMARLSSKNVKDERLLMDGPLVEADAFMGDQWRNFLVGTTGAGPAAVFALDVSDTSTNGLNEKALKWELDQSRDAELGHVLSAPEVGVLRDGRWVAIFGNGYESQSRRAQLFVVDLKDGSVIARIDTKAGSATSPNGLGGVKVMRDGNQVITAAYGGDLLGNMWKFDLSSNNEREWKVAFNGQPLFKDPKARAFTAAPNLVLHPRGGVMVLAATGKLFEEDDEKKRDEQSAYGLWDKARLAPKVVALQPGAAPGGKPAIPQWQWQGGEVIGRNELLTRRQTLSQGGKYSYETDTTLRIDWTRQRGWEVPLTMMPGKGLRNIVQPQLVSGMVLFEAMSPVIEADYAADPCADLVDVPGFSLFVDPLSGGMAKKAVIDINNNRKLDDMRVSGWKVANWSGRSVVLTENPPSPCTSAPCTAQSQTSLCPPDTLTHIALASKEKQVLCSELPDPSRWWWRELAVPDATYNAGKAADEEE